MFHVESNEISKKEFGVEKYDSIESIFRFTRYYDSIESYENQDHIIIQVNELEYVADVLIYEDIIKKIGGYWYGYQIIIEWI